MEKSNMKHGDDETLKTSTTYKTFGTQKAQRRKYIEPKIRRKVKIIEKNERIININMKDNIYTRKRMRTQRILNIFDKNSPIKYPRVVIPMGMVIYDLGVGKSCSEESLRLSPLQSVTSMSSDKMFERKGFMLMDEGNKTTLWCAWKRDEPNIILLWENNTMSGISKSLVIKHFELHNNTLFENLRDVEQEVISQNTTRVKDNILTTNSLWLQKCYDIHLSYHAYSDINLDFKVFVCVTNVLPSNYPKCIENGIPIFWITAPETQIGKDTTFPECDDNKLLEAIDSAQILFEQHSNMISLYPKFKDEKWCIGIGVFGKGFIPSGEMLLPSQWDGYNISVSNSYIKFASGTRLLNPMSTLNPVYPGCAISPQCLAPLSEICTLGTLGGYIVSNGAKYMITCGHLFVKNAKSGELCGIGTDIVQSTGLGHWIRKMKVEQMVKDPFDVWDKLLESRFGDKSGRVRDALNEIDHEGCPESFNLENKNNVVGEIKYVNFQEFSLGFENTWDIAICKTKGKVLHGFQVLSQGCSKAESSKYDVEMVINLDENEVETTRWTESDLRELLLKNETIECYSYGVRSGPLKGKLISLKHIFYYPININVHRKNLDTTSNSTRCIGEPARFKFVGCIVSTIKFDEGDSGAWVWSFDNANKKKIIGMVSFKYFQNNVQYGILIPVWEILRAFSENIVD